MGRCRLEEDADGPAAESVGARQDPQADRGADDGVDPGPAEHLEQDGGDDDADRAKRVREDLEVGAFDVQALLRSLSEEREGDEVHDEPERGDDEHRYAEDLGFSAEAPDGLDEHVDGHAEQEQRVDEGGEDLEPVEAERVLTGLGPALVPAGELDGGEGHAKPDDIGEHVARVGQQGEGVGEDPADGLDEEKHQDEDEGDGEALLVAGSSPQAAGPVVVSGAHHRTSSLWERCWRDRSSSMRTWASSSR